jgi:hypothetical protein
MPRPRRELYATTLAEQMVKRGHMACLQALRAAGWLAAAMVPFRDLLLAAAEAEQLDVAMWLAASLPLAAVAERPQGTRIRELLAEGVGSG